VSKTGLCSVTCQLATEHSGLTCCVYSAADWLTCMYSPADWLTCMQYSQLIG